jgi:hypothetical protein
MMKNQISAKKGEEIKINMKTFQGTAAAASR